MPSEQDKSREQKAAESEVESFRKDLGPFVVAAETTRMAMVFTDAKESNHPLIFVNDSFLSLLVTAGRKYSARASTFCLGGPPNLLRWRRSKPRSQAAPKAILKFVSAVRMAARSGLPSSSARFGIRAAMSSSISLRSLMSASTCRRKTTSGFCWPN